MSNLHFQPLLTQSPLVANSQYLPREYNLIIGPAGSIPPSMHRISIDTLTLSFGPDEHVLIGLDAYTNAEQWERRKLVIPSVDHEAALICTDAFDEHGIGPGGVGPLKYIYSDEQNRLLIRLGDRKATKRVRCLSCVICGLDENGKLVEIWVDVKKTPS